VDELLLASVPDDIEFVCRGFGFSRVENPEKTLLLIFFTVFTTTTTTM